MIDIKPFRIKVPYAVLDDLRERLSQTRWPIEPDAPPWLYGTSLAYMKDMVDYWRTGYDWRKSEAALNAFPNYLATVEGHDIHFIMEKGSAPDAPALILTHGWPGSVVEFLDVIAPLAHPERFGGDIADSFTVIVPSLPGYGFSAPPPQPITPRDIARLWNTLMTRNLGFPRYFAQGGDWGGIVTSWLAYDSPASVAAIHLNSVAFTAAEDAQDPLDAAEQAWIKATSARREPEAGYRTIQGTRPVTLSYGLTDSPAGLAAWILEKFHAWTLHGEDRPLPFTRDALLANVMLYWLPGPGPSSWLYVSLLDPATRQLPAGEKITVPSGFLLCPHDTSPPAPERSIRRSYNLVQRSVAAHGGHFPAFEQGPLFTEDVRTFFRRFRT